MTWFMWPNFWAVKRMRQITLDYVAQFLSGVAHLAKDEALEDAAAALAQQRAEGGAARQAAARISGLIRNRLDEQIAI